jgi:hypothetical protein
MHSEFVAREIVFNRLYVKTKGIDCTEQTCKVQIIHRKLAKKWTRPITKRQVQYNVCIVNVSPVYVII